MGGVEFGAGGGEGAGVVDGDTVRWGEELERLCGEMRRREWDAGDRREGGFGDRRGSLRVAAGGFAVAFVLEDVFGLDLGGEGEGGEEREEGDDHDTHV